MKTKSRLKEYPKEWLITRSESEKAKKEAELLSELMKETRLSQNINQNECDNLS
jgi:hypothetical protein